MSSLASGIGVTKQQKESNCGSSKFTSRFHWIGASQQDFRFAAAVLQPPPLRIYRRARV